MFPKQLLDDQILDRGNDWSCADDVVVKDGDDVLDLARCADQVAEKDGYHNADDKEDQHDRGKQDVRCK